MSDIPENLHWFGIDEDEPIILCPKCGEASATEDWEDCEPYCEDCGSHSGIMCPACGEMFDHVYEVDAFEEVAGNE